MSLLKERPLRKWLRERETIIPRKRLIDLSPNLSPLAHQELILRTPTQGQAILFSRLLEQKGFLTSVRHFNRSSLVDFHDSELRRMLTVVGTPYDHEKATEFALTQATGSMEFLEQPGLMGTSVVRVYGDVPVASLRKPWAKGIWTERVRIPENLTVEELHWHTENSLPATHVHVSGTDVNLEALVEFIGRCRDISKEFVRSGA